MVEERYKKYEEMQGRVAALPPEKRDLLRTGHVFFMESGHPCVFIGIGTYYDLDKVEHAIAHVVVCHVDLTWFMTSFEEAPELLDYIDNTERKS